MTHFRLFALLLALLVVPAALAQPEVRETRAERGERMLDRRMDRLDERLTLTDAQEARIRTIFVREFERLRARAEAERLDTDARRDALRLRHEAEQRDPAAAERHRTQEYQRMRTEWENVDRQIRRLLTRAQVREFNEMRREEIQRFEERMRERHDGPHGRPQDAPLALQRRPGPSGRP